MTDVTSPTIGKLAAALAKAQAKIGAVTKDHTARVQSKKGEGSSYSYTYATLADVWDMVRGPLAENDLAVMQMPMTTDAGTVLVTTLAHGESGEWVRSIVRLPVAGTADAQTLGSAITYMRRYALMSLVGVATEDDDGAAATRKPPQAPQRQQQRPAATKPAPVNAEAGGIGLDEAVALERFLSECGIVHALNFAKTTLKRNLEALSDLSPEDAKRVHDAAAERAAKAA